ncbi:PGF-pre-PGF domain-containing protein [Methanosarcina sp. KYL-1]|uniref:NosD domain-containing protein n=1 Tax=Methanosarcina sp. KYL-1 TaxID=2602068 RepID=UPI0021012F44|nr:NosD domain-containing protein [Methanosarcina sp. KYL-1]MCQ1537339.1 PGF-pre-PGF domain-containing protein [Methanosarcina sp. KYL-1]
MGVMKLAKKNNTTPKLLVVLVVLLIGVPAATAPPTALYVDGYGIGGNYSTIQAAVNDAGPGDTIFVYPGTYTESVNVASARDGLSIVSVSGNPEDTIVMTPSSNPCFYLASNGVTIRGFGMDGSAYYGPNSGVHAESHNNVIVNNSIDNCIFGVSFGASGNNYLRNNILNDTYPLYHSYSQYLENDIDTSNLAYGKSIYYLVGMSDVPADYFDDPALIYLVNCSNVTVSDLTLENGYYGLFLYRTNDSIIENNVLSNNEYGIYLEESSGNTISGNNASDSDNEGIYLEYSNGNEILDNEVYYCGDEGINLEYSDNNTISDNTANENYKGIRLYESEFNNISSNNASCNEYPGIVLCEADNNTVTWNTVLETSDGKGINLYYSSNNTLSYNTVNDSYSKGIDLYSECNYNTLIGNTVTYNECKGIEIDGTHNTLIGNNVSYNGGTGIATDDSDAEFTTLIDNIVNYNGCNGIRLQGSNNYVEGNTANGNENGIFLGSCYETPYNNTAINNTASGNIYCGILLRYIYESEVSGNTADQNGVAGIYLSECGENNVTDNTVDSNGYIEEGIERVSLTASDESNKESNKESCKKNSEKTTFKLGFDLSKLFNLFTSSSEYPSAGIYLENSYDNNLIGNTIENNSGSGLSLTDSEGNTIYNNYFNNINNTYLDENPLPPLLGIDAPNVWNIDLTEGENIVGGPYLGGNFWATPEGNGFSQTAEDEDEDGICDAAYNVTEDGENVDYFPLIEVPEPEPEPEPEHVRESRSSPNYIPAPSGDNAGPIDAVQKKVVAGTETHFQFQNPENGVLGVGFESEGYSGMVVVRVEGADEENSGSVDEPKGKVYRHMKISIGNERFEENLDGGYIEFRVPKSWAEENGIDPSTIALNRYNNDKWNALPTEMTGEDDGFYYFRAETPGFSLYAITGEQKNTGAAEEAEVINPVEEDESETITGEEQTKDEKSESSPGFEGTFAALGILASVFFVRKGMFK